MNTNTWSSPPPHSPLRMRPLATSPPPPSPPPRSHLLSALLGDVLCALSVTLGIAFPMTVIDRAIVEKAAGTAPSYASSVKGAIKDLGTRPGKYVSSPMFLMMWGVYASTYAAANSIRTLNEHYSTPPSTRDRSLFLGTTVVNSASTLLKDRAYAKAFGQAQSKGRSVPAMSYALWCLRDCLVIGSSFVLPTIVQVRLQTDLGLDRDVASKIAQFSCPVLTQFVAGPVQLLGLDLFNRPLPSSVPLSSRILQRLSFVRENFAGIVAMRVCRIAPAYGLGGIGNTAAREAWREMLLARRVRSVAEEGTGEGADELVELVVRMEKRGEERRKRRETGRIEPFVLPKDQ